MSEPPVEVYAGKFAGNFDLDVALAQEMHMDSPVTFLVTTRISGESKTATADGRIKRSDTFKVYEIVPLDADVFDRVMGAIVFPDDEPQQTEAEAGWLPDEDEDLSAHLEVDDSSVDEDEVFSPGEEPEFERIKIAGAYDPMGESDETVEEDPLLSFLNDDDSSGVTRDADGRDTALLDFLEV